MTDYKILVTESNGMNFRVIIQARDSYTAQRIAESQFYGKRVQVMGSCEAVGY
jgi:hypothetical protein